MLLMPSRQIELQAVMEGLRLSHVPLVGFAQGQYYAAGVTHMTDDPGLYYFVPLISGITGLPLDRSVDLFLFFLIFAGWVLGSALFLQAFRSWPGKILGPLGLLILSALTYHISDVYVAQEFAVLSTIPLFLCFRRSWLENRYILWGGLAWVGLASGCSNLIRAQAGTGIVLFAFLWILLSRLLTVRQKAAGLLVLACFFMAPYLHFGALEKQRDRFLSEKTADYQPVPLGHHFWHNAYIGLGYLPNRYGIQYLDENADAKVKSIDPTASYQSEAYLGILKGEILKLLRTDPFFILRTVFAKALKLAWYALLFGNIGWFFLWRLKPGPGWVLPIAAAAAFDSLPGLLVMPFKNYVLGMISLVVVAGLYLCGLGADRYWADARERGTEHP